MAVLAASALEVTLAIAAATALCVLWVVTLFLLVGDDIPGGMKVVWFLLVTLLAPIGIPVYLVLRSRRHRPTPAAG
jgi:hypothetical protein